MDLELHMDTWLVISLIGIFIALRVWHPITSYFGSRKKR